MITHDYNGTVSFLAQFYNDKISVVCDDRDFGSHSLRNRGIGYNNSFGNKLKQVYKEIMGKEFAVIEKVKTGGLAGGFEERKNERTDESIGIELFIHVYYLVIARLIQRGDNVVKEMMTKTDQEIFRNKGTAGVERSCIIADLDLWGGNYEKLILSYRMGHIERKTAKRDIFKHLMLRTDALTYLSK